LGFLHLALEGGLAGSNHDVLSFGREIINGGFAIQSGLDTGDGFAMDACLLDVVQASVEIDELLVHVIEGLAEIVSEVLEQLLHEVNGGSHESSGLRIPGVTRGLGWGDGVGNGEGKVAARVWERERGVGERGRKGIGLRLFFLSLQ
jgi:hypothetical protein